MKPINKILMTLLCLPFILTACTEEVDYTAAERLSSAQVYFPNNAPSTVELGRTETSFNVELRRMNKAGAISVPLAVTETTGIFSIPATVNFAADSDIATLTIAYDPANLNYDDYKSISITINDESVATPYGKSTYVFKAGIPAPWESLGKGQYIDNYFFNKSYELEIQRHLIDRNKYRVVDPFSQGFEDEGLKIGEEQAQYFEFTILPAGSEHKGVTTTTDGLVVYDDINTGFYDNTNGGYRYYCHPSGFQSLSTESKWLKNIVTQTSDTGEPEIIQIAPYVYIPGVGGWNYTQMEDLILIVFPGVELTDYTVEIEYSGRYTDAAGAEFAVASYTLGEDVESAKIALVSGNDVDAAVAGIVDGSIESVEVTESGTIQLPCSATGEYSFVIVTYAEGEAKKAGAHTFNFVSTQN